MMVNEIEGAALARVMNPDAVTRLPLRRELEGALRELRQTLREADSDLCADVSFIDLVADKNTYPVPDNTDTIRKIERRDLGGNTSPDDQVFIPVGKVPIGMVQRARTPCYALSPEGIVIWPSPPLDFERGIRILTLPSAELLPNDNQEPLIPRPLHEPLVAHLIRRLGTLANVQLAPGAADFIATQERFLTGYINPNGREYIQRFARTKSTYHPRRF